MTKFDNFETENTQILKSLKNFKAGFVLDLFDDDVDDTDYDIVNLKNL